MKRVLVTGVSGVGKSAVVGVLRGLRYKAVDTDYEGYCAPGPDVEPLLRSGADTEIETDRPLDDVVSALLVRA